MVYPKISIVIPTFNSGKTLQQTLRSIYKQTYPKNKVEILVIDGKSIDNTKKIAKQYNCKIFSNPKTELIYGKHIGYKKAFGKYIMFLDSDEVLENKNSLMLKIHAFSKNKNVRAVIPSGYKSPKDVSPVNDYINEFGDPFSFFIYRESKGYKFLIKEFSNRFKIIDQDKNCVIFDFKQSKQLPLIELWAGGSMIDKQYLKSKFPQAEKDPTIIPHLFYVLIRLGNLLAICKNDNTIHYSCESMRRYYIKLASRVKNNIFLTSMGKGGFEGREKYQKKVFHQKKYYFIPYSFSLILPIADAFYLACTRKNIFYMSHPFLCLFTSFLIIYYYAFKLLGIKPNMNTYGN